MTTENQLFQAEKLLPLSLNQLQCEHQKNTEQVWNSPPFPTTYRIYCSNDALQHYATGARQKKEVKETYRQNTEPWASALSWCCSCRTPPPSGSGWGRCARRSRTRAPRRSRSPASTGTAQSTRPPGSQRCCCKGQSGQSLGI